jgi:hypothetical protein
MLQPDHPTFKATVAKGPAGWQQLARLLITHYPLIRSHFSTLRQDFADVLKLGESLGPSSHAASIDTLVEGCLQVRWFAGFPACHCQRSDKCRRKAVGENGKETRMSRRRLGTL